ncbi:unnamed protein product [Alopecurus aequalis]
MPSPTWASTAAVVTGERRGFHLVQIVGYSRAKELPVGRALESCPFMVGGYCWAIQVLPGGQAPEDADFISVYFSLLQDVARPVKVRGEFSFIDEVYRQDPRHVRARQITEMPSCRSYMGYARFMSREEFEKSEHLKSDSFTIRLDLIVVEEGRQQ